MPSLAIEIKAKLMKAEAEILQRKASVEKQNKILPAAGEREALLEASIQEHNRIEMSLKEAIERIPVLKEKALEGRSSIVTFLSP